MKLTDIPSQISADTIRAHLCSYDSLVPDKIREVEEIRLNTIPETLVQRKKDGKLLFEKTELTSLVEWKLCVCPALCPADTFENKPQRLTTQ